MTLIEGIGDEVTITVTLFVLFVTFVAAWVSTRVTESRLTLTQSQLSGLRIELNELTPEEQSDEEAGSSTESTEFEHLSDELSIEQPVTGSEPGAGGIEAVAVGLGKPEEHPPPKGNAGKPAVETEDGSRLEGASPSDAQSSGVGDVSGAQDCVEDNKNNSINLSERTNNSDESTNQSQRTNLNETDNSDSGDISLKIKFLNETEKMVQTRIEETVGNFKRLNFAEESQDGRVVHLIFNGQFLRDDSRQLGSYSVVDNCVLHCHISQHQQSPGTAQEQPDQGDIDLGQFMVPLFACTIGFVWYLRWQYSYMFNTMSTMSLSAVTVLFMLAVLAAWRG